MCGKKEEERFVDSANGGKGDLGTIWQSETPEDYQSGSGEEE